MAKRGKNKNLSFLGLLKVVAILGILASIVIPEIREMVKADPPVEVEKVARAQGPAAPWPPINNTTAPISTDLLLRKNYYVILDGSGSMETRGCSGNISKFESAKWALTDFFSSIPNDANVGLYIFDIKGRSERVPLGVENRDRLQQALQISAPQGGTPLSVAIETGYSALTRQASSQLGYGEYHMVVVTDGDASKGWEPDAVVNKVIDGSAIMIHTIGYCIGEGHSLNQPGRTLYASVDNAQTLSQELHAVLAESERFDVSQF